MTILLAFAFVLAPAFALAFLSVIPEGNLLLPTNAGAPHLPSEMWEGCAQ